MGWYWVEVKKDTQKFLQLLQTEANMSQSMKSKITINLPALLACQTRWKAHITDIAKRKNKVTVEEIDSKKKPTKVVGNINH